LQSCQMLTVREKVASRFYTIQGCVLIHKPRLVTDCVTTCWFSDVHSLFSSSVPTKPTKVDVKLTASVPKQGKSCQSEWWVKHSEQGR
jgi:hypothetical protein